MFETLNKMFGGNITNDPTVALLGRLPRGVYLIQILLATAIKFITIRWLKPPTHNMWTDKIKAIYQMEQITYSLRLQKHTFTKRWSPAMRILI